jgi:hypothetical protein
MAVLLLFVSTAKAQTKRIAHYSHSGTAHNFESALTHTGFFNMHSNFGRAPQKIVKNAQLDSLIVLDANRIIMVTSEVCKDVYAPTNEPRIWKAGRDTMSDHPHFSPQFSEKEIKQTIRQQYHFVQNKPTVLVGYDRPIPPSRKLAPTYHQKDKAPKDTLIKRAYTLPIYPGSDKNKPSSPLLSWVLLAAFAASAAGLFDVLLRRIWSKISV